jgi:predicted AlkP superfamily pyrophosphatase or phosphodiesterase
MLAIAAALVLYPAHTKLVSIVWDGAADWVVDEMLAHGELPNVARLAANGVHAKAVIPGWPSKTAVGHAAIFTGTWADVNGVANNAVGLLPRSEHDLSESRSGFNGNSLIAEPIWVTAAKAGWKVVACSAATSFPPDPFVAQIKAAGANPANFMEFSGFETTWAPGKMIPMPKPSAAYLEARTDVDVAGTTFHIRVFDDPKDRVKGYDSVAIAPGDGKEQILKPKVANETAAGWSQPYLLQKDGGAANLYFRLWSLAPDGSKMELYQRKVSAIFGTEKPETIKQYVEAYGGFHDDEFFAYQSGLLGKPIYQGGDGEPEKRLVELVSQDCGFLKKSFAYAWKTWQPDVLLHYTPMTDSAGHTWMGGIDPDMKADPLMADKLWTIYKSIYRLQDDWLGFILDTVGKDTVVALMSDHGMAGSRATLYVNKILEDAGLCVFDAKGQVDWSKSRAAVPAWSDFFVVVNTKDHKGGVVAPEDRDSVCGAVQQALLAARDDADRSVITMAVRPEEAAGLGIGGPTGGDVYFDTLVGLYPSGRQSSVLLAPVNSPIGNGVHGFFPYRRRMNAIFYAAGPGLPKGVELPVIRHIDIMPTLCKAVGLPRPKDATGVAY